MLDSELISHNVCTQGFHIIDNFLELGHYRSLRRLAQKLHQEGSFRQAKIGLRLEAQHNEAIRTDEICWLEEESDEPSLRAYLNQTFVLANILNQTLFLGLAEFESHFATYQPGAYYKKHVDQFTAKKTRKISCVYYLNEHWNHEFGGELKLYDKQDNLIQHVVPQGNRFICFNSELPHEVCLTNQPRYSIAGWMKTRPL